MIIKIRTIVISRISRFPWRDYLLLTIGYGFGEDGIYPPEIGMWVPNVVMGGIGFFMLIQTGRERSLMIGFFIRRFRRLAALMLPSKRSS